jgi:hypothetical protein
MAGERNSGGVVKGAWTWLYCWLRISLLWFGKLAGKSTIPFRRWRLRGKEQKSLTNLGGLIYELYKENQRDLVGDSRVQEIIQTLRDVDGKRDQLRVRLQEKENQYRKKVMRLKEQRSSRLKEETSDSIPESDPGADQGKEPQAQ